MNKNFKIIQITGLSGLFLLGFVILGVFCGFILFPIWVMMIGWNSIVKDILHGPAINYFQAMLLWSVISLAVYLILKNSISIKIQRDETFKNKDIKDIITEMKKKEEESEEKDEILK